MEKINSDFNPYATFDAKFKKDLEQFNRLLQQEPPGGPKGVLKYRDITKYIDGKKTKVPFAYLPISWIEKQLAEIFGAIQFLNFRTRTVGNEIEGIIDFKYFHPVFRQWLTLTGTAAVMIAGAEGATLEKKYKASCETASPHLLSDCKRNAVKSLGRWFGQDLNRELRYDYRPEHKSSETELNELKAKEKKLRQSAKALEQYKATIEGFTITQIREEGPGLFDSIVKEDKLTQGDFLLLRAYTGKRLKSLQAQQQLKGGSIQNKR